jgi:hypothetical protein
MKVATPLAVAMLVCDFVPAISMLALLIDVGVLVIVKVTAAFASAPEMTTSVPEPMAGVESDTVEL